MIETNYGDFNIIKNFRDAFVLDDFNKKYVDYLNAYTFIVGDYSAGLLRMKGFTKEKLNQIPDYLVESCAPNCAYFILENPKHNASLNKEE